MRVVLYCFEDMFPRARNDKFVATQMILSFAVLILLLMIFVSPRTPVQHTDRGLTPVTLAGSVAGVFLCIFLSITKLPGRGPLPGPKLYVTNMLSALAGAELVALLGIFVGAPSIGPWPFAITAWILMLGVVLPRTLRYFRIYESQGSGDSSSNWNSR